MYNNAGGKVKGLASAITTLMMIVVVLAGVVAMFESFFGGLLVIVIGCIAAWLSGLMMAAFGELVENTYYIRKMLADKMNVDSKGAPIPVAPAYADAHVTPAEINAVMNRDGIPYGEAVVVAKKEKLNGTPKAPESNICPNCGSPRKSGSAFCGFCGTKF